MSDLIGHYKNSFEESRQEFIRLANAGQGELQSHPVGDLSFESLYIAPTGKKEKLVILTSGIHGIEGFTGSALQRYFLSENFFGLKDANTGVLIIHGINPYGFKNEKRVTENNVDLNRNFDTNEELFKNVNDEYAKLRDFLNTKSSRISFYASAIRLILKHGMENLRKAILRGQYQFADGIFFGGKKFEPQVKTIQNILSNVSEGFEKVLLIDLHTGYGKRGKLHLFGDRSPFIDQTYMDSVFKGLPVEYGQEKDFYVISGGFTVFLAKLFLRKAKFAGVVFEFGTLNSHKPLGSMESLYRMVNEDKKSFREMFYPSSPEWRVAVMSQFRSTLTSILSSY